MPRKISLLALSAAALLCLQFGGDARSQTPTMAPDGQVYSNQKYRLVDLGACTGACVIGGINSSCEVAGFDVPTGGDATAFLWRPGVAPQALEGHRTTQVSPTSFRAFAVNDAHRVVGFGNGPRMFGLIWTTSLTTSQWTAAPVNMAIGENLNEAYAINRDGSAVGDIKSGASTSAMFWDAGATRNLGDLPHTAPGNNAIAYGINASDVIVGTGEADVGAAKNVARAFFMLTSRFGMRELDALNGSAAATDAHAVNATGTIVGSSGGAGPHIHAVRWTFSGGPTTAQITDLGAYPSGTPPLLDSAAVAINDSGSIVGSGSGTGANGGAVKHALAWPASGAGAIDLNEHIPNPQGFTMVEATGINKNGVISGRATASNTSHAVLLLPTNWSGGRSATMCVASPLPSRATQHRLP